MYNEAQGLLEVKSSTILDLAGSNQFLFFFVASSFVVKPETQIRAVSLQPGAGI